MPLGEFGFFIKRYTIIGYCGGEYLAQFLALIFCLPRCRFALGSSWHNFTSQLKLLYDTIEQHGSPAFTMIQCQTESLVKFWNFLLRAVIFERVHCDVTVYML